jgi:hypothetical protein
VDGWVIAVDSQVTNFIIIRMLRAYRVPCLKFLSTFAFSVVYKSDCARPVC